MARGEGAIDFCTDQSSGGFNRPECEIRAGDAVRGRGGGSYCAPGPAKAVMLRRGPGYGEFSAAAFVHAYQVYPRDAQGRASSRAQGQFIAMFDKGGGYLGAVCPADGETP